MKKRMRINMAVALALILGGSGCYSFGNVSEAAGIPKAAETAEVSEAASMAISAGTEDSAAEISIPAQAEQNGKNGAAEVENGQEVSEGTERSNEEQQELQESLEEIEYPDNSDFTEDESKAKLDSSVGTNGSGESAEKSSSSTASDSEESLGQSSDAGTEESDAFSGDNMEESNSVSSSDQDNNAGEGGRKESAEQGGSSGSESSQGLSSVERSSSLDSTDVAGNGQITDLQIPEKIAVVVDPWEIMGESQIHSEQYIISNEGISAVRLTFYNLACIPQGTQGGIVKTERDGIHEGSSKAIYMEMVFGNGDSVLFTEEGSSRYEIELASGEELSFWITGEVNENAAEPWRDGDFQVMISYQWDNLVQTQVEADGGKVVSGEIGDASSDAGEIISDGTAEKVGNIVDSDSAADKNQPLDEKIAAGENIPLEEGSMESGSLSPEADVVDEEGMTSGRASVKEGDMSSDKSPEEGGSVTSDEASAGNGNIPESVEDKNAVSHNDSEENGQVSSDIESI